MRVTERRALRGPNVHSRRPCFLAIVDLEELDGVASTAIPGFVDRLLALLPSLAEHRCSRRRRGGFVERLHEGTYMAHIVEHVAIDLQVLAGHAVGFGKTRHLRGMPRHYRIVVSYRAEAVASAAIDAAVDLVQRTARAEPFDSAAALAELRRLVARSAIGPSTRAIVEAAERRRIPVLRLTDEANLFQLGWGHRQQRIQATLTSRTNHVAVGIASDKELTKRLLAEAGIPVPRGRVVKTLDAARAAAHAACGAVVVKPLNGNQGKGVTTGVADDGALATAFERAQAHGRSVIVEEHIAGDDYRVLVVGARMVAAARRVPPEVVGDGASSVRALVDAANRDPRRGEGHGNVLTTIRLDAAALEELARHGLDADAVPAAGRVVRLRGNANLSTGGTAADVTALVHSETERACVRAARTIGLDVAGIDLVCSDIGEPLGAQRGAIVEVNAAPGIRMHEHPSQGEPRAVGRAIVESLFPEGNGRIPVLAITGGGSTTVALAVADVLQRMGRVTGVACSDGVRIGGERVLDGDADEHHMARSVLAAPEVEVALLETTCAGILKRGLAIDRCDVGVVLGVERERVGEHGVATLARVQGVLVEATRRVVVLNADDVRCAALAGRARRGAEIVWFSLRPEDGVFARHVGGGGRGVYERDGMLTWAEGARQVPLVAVSALPPTRGGSARRHVAEAMAACAALLALGAPAEHVARELAAFTSSGRDAAGEPDCDAAPTHAEREALAV
ncbi:cyanophycin synthetase [Piscinibacter koreensis]|uniref:Cyanophycin synthetase n=1 Tax=Piscinibacter koreensis TaxID=2742824 RepID=A0A7Y6NMN7_9BURK|nr:cyanophycin synthetase [Schlegelella koreensis]NUZ05872.1 cyanophycin synthetase [Schlegelella koreensis]